MRGREGLASSQVSATVWERKSIQRRSAAERARAYRSEWDVMEMGGSDRLEKVRGRARFSGR